MPILQSMPKLVGSWLAAAATLFMLAATPAAAAPLIDCPLRDRPFTVDSPLIDILLSPAAKAAVESTAPALLKRFPPKLMSVDAPSFAAIVSLRTVADYTRTPEEALGPVGEALARIPVTAADRTARCARYDVERPSLAVPAGRPRLLLFQKMTGYRDGPSVEAAEAAFRQMAARRGWSLTVADKGGAMTPATLKKFDLVIWNNVSGDVLTLSQRRAFQNYLRRGGGFLGVHGSGGDPDYYWDWYRDELIGAWFVGHPTSPQFQNARVIVDDSGNGVAAGLPRGWTMNDEWYSFKTSPRATGARVILKLDEASYQPTDFNGRDLRMDDHPIAWTRCIGNGRAFYSAIGHRPETYAEPNHARLLEQAILWAAGRGATRCIAGREIGGR